MNALIPVFMAAFLLTGPAQSATPTPVPDPSLTGPPIHFFAKLSADEEVPPVDSKATGLVEFSLNRSDLKLTWKISFTGLTGAATAVYIHGPERPGRKAPMVLELGTRGLKSPAEGSVVLDDNKAQYFVNGRVYVNIHTAKYQDGEVRGQIERGAVR